MDRLKNLRMIEPVLTTIAIGFSNSEFIAEKFCPIVPVDKEESQIPVFDKTAFLIYKTERAARGATNFMKPSDLGKIALVTDEHDLAYPIDYREGKESIYPLKILGTKTVVNGIQLRREKMTADLLQDLSTYPVNHKVTLTADNKWTNKTKSDPIDQIKTAKSQIRKTIGKYPNRLGLGVTAFEALVEHPAIIERIKYSGKAVVTVDDLKTILGFDEIVVGLGIYADKPNGQFFDLWEDNAIMAYVPNKGAGELRLPEEPSFGYTPRRTGNPYVDSFFTEGGKVENVRNTDNFGVAVVWPSAGYLIKDTCA